MILVYGYFEGCICTLKAYEINCLVLPSLTNENFRNVKRAGFHYKSTGVHCSLASMDVYSIIYAHTHTHIHSRMKVISRSLISIYTYLHLTARVKRLVSHIRLTFVCT